MLKFALIILLLFIALLLSKKNKRLYKSVREKRKKVLDRFGQINDE